MAINQSNDKKIYHLSLKQGMLDVRLLHTEYRMVVIVKGDVMETLGGITLEAGFRYSISEEELNCLTTLDLAAYDDTEVLAEFNLDFFQKKNNHSSCISQKPVLLYT